MFNYEKTQKKACLIDEAKGLAEKNHENSPADQNLERTTREMTIVEQKKLVSLFDAFEKEIHFMVVDIVASMCRLTDEEQKIVDAVVPED